MTGKRKIELLAPAKNLECGIAAIDHGADAVYIGAAHFGARALAGNSIENIKALCNYAHQFFAKVYITVNTIIYENELQSARQLIGQLAEAGADGILVQDMSIANTVLLDGRMELHASTQTDNRNIEKVKWLKDVGFSRVVLARELTLDEIKSIHDSVPDIELEVFVHGALCVSYSGACYASQYCFGRSANRGECAQFCRLSFNLVDVKGKELLIGKHLLSLKDLCQIDELEALMDAGVSSFKIEGRLKDVYYIKNVVAAYSQRLDSLISKHPEKYCRSSKGKVTYTFTPNLCKTFNRGFTNYFLKGRKPSLASFDTPKAMGEYVGNVKEFGKGFLIVTGIASFANGDGLCFINSEHKLEGFRVNRAVNNHLFPLKMPSDLKIGTALYRNSDQKFVSIMSSNTAIRKVPVSMILDICQEGLVLTLKNDGVCSSTLFNIKLEMARKPQYENMRCQLSKLGDTPYEAAEIIITPEACKYFVPSSFLSKLRRLAVKEFSDKCLSALKSTEKVYNFVCPQIAGKQQIVSSEKINVANIANSEALHFYSAHYVMDVPTAYEVSDDNDKSTVPLMTCRYCLRYELGHCVKRGGVHQKWTEPLFLKLSDGRHFRLAFDCNKCQMKIYAEN